MGACLRRSWRSEAERQAQASDLRRSNELAMNKENLNETTISHDRWSAGGLHHPHHPLTPRVASWPLSPALRARAQERKDLYHPGRTGGNQRHKLSGRSLWRSELGAQPTCRWPGASHAEASHRSHRSRRAWSARGSTNSQTISQRIATRLVYQALLSRDPALLARR